MTGKRLSNHRGRIVAILARVILVGVTSWSIAGCAQNTQKPAETTTQAPSEDKDVDVHVKVDLPDTVTIK